MNDARFHWDARHLVLVKTVVDIKSTAIRSFIADSGIRGGITYNTTNESGEAAVEKSAKPHEIEATAGHQLGIDHHRQAYE